MHINKTRTPAATAKLTLPSRSRDLTHTPNLSPNQPLQQPGDASLSSCLLMSASTYATRRYHSLPSY